MPTMEFFCREMAKETLPIYLKKKSGLCLLGDVRAADTIEVGKQPYLVLGICDGPICFIKKP